MSLIFEPSTERQIQTLARSLPQALLLTGADGAGLLTTAKYLAGPALAGIIQPTNKDGQADASGVIHINQIRDLRQYTRGVANSKAVYVIDDASAMNHQAQNAFLKLLHRTSRIYCCRLSCRASSGLLSVRFLRRPASCSSLNIGSLTLRRLPKLCF